MRTHDNILMHELIGLECSVVSSANMFQTGITGKIADETMKNIVLENRGKMSTIQKKGTIVRVALCGRGVEINCDAMIARPEDRIKKKFHKW